jgi:hypothetical protein
MNPSLAQGLHLDHSELWINPNNPNHLAVGNDGGLYVSYDKGLSWMHYNNIPTGEFYDLTIDQTHGVVYGGTQDDATVYGPPKELNLNFSDPWKYLWIDPWDGGDGCVSQVDPEDDGIVYYSMQHGAAVRLDRRTDTAISIQPELPERYNDTLRFNYITPYFISPHQSKTLYHGGNYIFKSLERGSNWQVISPNLARSAIKEKKSVSMGALVESKIAKGLLYAGTDHGACWVSKDDGANWQEISQGLANNYIRSICPSKFAKERVYLAMTGINYDDLHSYLYVSDDYGTHWKSINAGLPDEPINVILEDPSNPNVLYAGSIRGVYVSLNGGNNWSYLGIQMPVAAIADLEIMESTMELLVATHGHGLYKINLHPIQVMAANTLSKNANFLFEIPEAKRPWYNSAEGEPDYRTVEKVPISFWLREEKTVTLVLKDTTGKEIWKTTFPGQKGFNQYRWDLVFKRETSDYPYFVHYEHFVEAGAYTLMMNDGENESTQPFLVASGVSPYKK